MNVEVHPRVRANRERINRTLDHLVGLVETGTADGTDRRTGLYWLGVARQSLLLAALRWEDPA